MYIYVNVLMSFFFFREGQMIKAELCFFYKWHPTVRLKYLFFSIQMVDYAYQEFWRHKKKMLDEIALPFFEFIVQYAKNQSYR